MASATLLRPATATIASSLASVTKPAVRVFVHGRPHADLGHCYDEPTGGYVVHTIACRRTGSSAPRTSSCVPSAVQGLSLAA